MSLLPSLRNFADNPFNDAFGYGLHPEQFFNQQPSLINSNLWPRIYNRQWAAPNRNEHNNNQAALLKSNIGKDGFQVCMDVEHFQPNEITVKTIDNTVVVEGKHDEKEDDHGHIYRHFVRRYQLPKEFDMRDVVSTLSSDGVLTIKAPTKANAIETNERVIQIQQTGPAHLSVKSNEKPKEGEKMTE